LVLGAVAAIWPILGLPAAFLSFIGWLALSAGTAPLPRLERWCVGVAALLAAAAVTRFVVLDAVPGIVSGGREAVQQRAVSRLRDVLFAEDAMRRAGWIDPDADGIGSAALIGELCGGPPLRGQQPQPAPVLSFEAIVDTALGPAARAGAYLYTVCLPRRGGGWSARASADVDEELAERRFVAYAWPAPGTPFNQAFFLDEHENILAMTLPTAERGGVTPSVGAAGADAAHGLTCDSALGAERDARWGVWRGKKARVGLPGDRADSP
jgi:hypothetical protein